MGRRAALPHPPPAGVLHPRWAVGAPRSAGLRALSVARGCGGQGGFLGGGPRAVGCEHRLPPGDAERGEDAGTLRENGREGSGWLSVPPRPAEPKGKTQPHCWSRHRPTPTPHRPHSHPGAAAAFCSQRFYGTDWRAASPPASEHPPSPPHISRSSSHTGTPPGRGLSPEQRATSSRGAASSYGAAEQQLPGEPQAEASIRWQRSASPHR